MRTINLTEKDIERFWTKVDKSGGEDSCWIWKDSKDESGYGSFWAGHDQYGAHRVSMCIYLGRSLIEGEQALHNCPTVDNPSCVNPKHLYVGTGAENMQDKARKGRASRLKGEKNPWSKLTDEDVILMRKLYKTGEYLQKDLAKMFGLKDVGNVSCILLGDTWKHLNEVEAPIKPWEGARADIDVDIVKAMAEEGNSATQISRIIGCSIDQAAKILDGSWKRGFSKPKRAKKCVE